MRASVAAAIGALAVLAHNFHEKARKLHVSHSHGGGVARRFEEDDPMRQGAEGQRLKRAIQAEKEDQDRKKATEKKPSRSRRGGYSRPSYRNGGRQDSYRDYDDRDRRTGGGGNSGNTRRCYICDSRDHLSNDCPKKRRS